ncbi:hypothetical protein ANCCAN_24704, partial [Ancylostoma caninum]
LVHIQAIYKWSVIPAAEHTETCTPNSVSLAQPTATQPTEFRLYRSDMGDAAVTQNLRVYGVKIWPHVCNTVKLKRSSAEKRELYRKCTGLVLRRDPDVYDRSLSRILAKRYTEYGLWAGTLTRYALVIRNKLRPNNNGRTIPLTVIDDDDENEGMSQSWPEVDIGGVFPHVDLGRKRSDFDRLFDGFVQQTHEAFLINKPTLEPNVLREMVLEAFKGKKTIRSVAKRRIEEEVTVMGPIYGEGDSLITLLSLVGMPPQRTYVFLGCYFGLGFAPFESLLLLMCLKCLYPNKIYLLKGHLEEPASIKSLGLDDWLFRRRVPRESVLRVSETVMVGFRHSID